MKGSIDYKDFVKLQTQLEQADMDIFLQKVFKGTSCKIIAESKATHACWEL